MIAKPLCHIGILASLAAALSGCDKSADDQIAVIAIGDPASLYQTHTRLPPPAQLLRSATFEGLVAFDAHGRVVPALADRWIVTDGGLSYIFRLRDGAWPNGTPVTADSARAGLQQAIAALRGSAMGLDLAAISQVRTMAGRVLELRLNRPQPDLLQLLAQPELGIAWQGRGNGPMQLRRTGRTALLQPIAPEERGLPSEEDWADRARRIELRALPAAKALDQFGKGEADAVFGGRLEDLPRVDEQGIARGALRMDPVSGLFGLMVVHGTGFLSKAENREAVAMAIDRESIAALFGLDGWTFTSRIVGPGLEGDDGTIGERWVNETLEGRRARAAARVAAWRGASDQPLVLRLGMPSGPGSDVLAARLADDLAPIGITLKKVALSSDADLRLMDVVARYPQPDWYLNQLSCANALGLCDSTADVLARRAAMAQVAADRHEFYAQAEARLTKTNSYIPLGVPVRWSLISGDITGFAPNRWNIHPLLPLAMRPK